MSLLKHHFLNIEKVILDRTENTHYSEYKNDFKRYSTGPKMLSFKTTFLYKDVILAHIKNIILQLPKLHVSTKKGSETENEKTQYVLTIDNTS